MDNDDAVQMEHAAFPGVVETVTRAQYEGAWAPLGWTLVKDEPVKKGAANNG